MKIIYSLRNELSNKYLHNIRVILYRFGIPKNWNTNSNKYIEDVESGSRVCRARGRRRNSRTRINECERVERQAAATLRHVTQAAPPAGLEGCARRARLRPSRRCCVAYDRRVIEEQLFTGCNVARCEESSARRR